jgi:hypothetical protein
MVLIHGMAIFPEWWESILKALPETMTVCAPELLGFGRSPGKRLEPQRFSLKLFREQIDLIRERMGWTG